MKVMVLLQARTSSSRLPAKVLLPLAGMPLVVLAARRAGNTGLSVMVATSDDPSDDGMCQVLSDWQVSFYRGPLADTLDRFVGALSSLSDDHVIVRLTGDNPVPDGHFIGAMLRDYEVSPVSYLSASGPESGLPYGVSAEITRLKHLRQAHSTTDSAYDREHVMPWIVRHLGGRVFDRFAERAQSHLRCTVDTFDDYQRAQRLFQGVEEPVTQPWWVLADRLQDLSGLVTSRAIPELVLGTAQLGMAYGIANRSGRPEPEQARTIVRTAIAHGAAWLDTARGYGDSEQVLGDALTGGWQSRVEVITKLSTLTDCPPEASPEVVGTFVDCSLYQSCHALRVTTLDVVMLHRATQFDTWDGAVWERLLHHRQRGLIRCLGVSVQTPEELSRALAVEAVAFIQLPMNLLDHRWREGIGEIVRAKVRRPLIVHVRSALLQGLLASDSLVLWRRAHCPDAGRVLEWLDESARRFADGDRVRLCLNYVVSQSWVDGVVVGMETLEQLHQNLVRLDTARLTADQIDEIERGRPSVAEQTLNPVTWGNGNV